jgi:hypothetical protein
MALVTLYIHVLTNWTGKGLKLGPVPGMILGTRTISLVVHVRKKIRADQAVPFLPSIRQEISLFEIQP